MSCLLVLLTGRTQTPGDLTVRQAGKYGLAEFPQENEMCFAGHIAVVPQKA